MDTQNRSVDFGKLPLKENELLPAGALDNAAPDTQRLTEATGNEGASFERSYRRAALVMWPRDRSADVLLQGGVRAVVPYLKDIAQRCSLPSASRAERSAVRSIASRIVRVWKRELADANGIMDGEEPSRSEMVIILGQLADAELLEAFVNDIVVPTYDGSENEALAANATLLGARRAGELFSTLARAHVPTRRGECVDLLSRLVHEHGHAGDSAWLSGLRTIAAAIIEALPKRQKRSAASDLDDRLGRPHDTRRATESDAEMVVMLLDSLAAIDAPDIRRAACDAVAAAHSFDSARVIVSALSLVRAQDRKPTSADDDYLHLWHHAATHAAGPQRASAGSTEGLASGGENPLHVRRLPGAADVRARSGRANASLSPAQRSAAAFARADPAPRSGHDTRNRAPRIAANPRLYETRRTYERQRTEHKADVTAMSTLLRVIDGARDELATLAARMAEATGSELACG